MEDIKLKLISYGDFHYCKDRYWYLVMEKDSNFCLVLLNTSTIHEKVQPCILSIRYIYIYINKGN